MVKCVRVKVATHRPSKIAARVRNFLANQRSVRSDSQDHAMVSKVLPPAQPTTFLSNVRVALHAGGSHFVMHCRRELFTAHGPPIAHGSNPRSVRLVMVSNEISPGQDVANSLRARTLSA